MQPLFKYDQVILIDDNYIDNIIHQKIIESCQFAKQIIIFESAAKAIDYLRKIELADNKHPIIIFLDLRMPEMDGYDFLDEIKKLPDLKSGEIRIHVLSSSLDPNDHKKIDRNPFTESFISKPLTAQILKQL